MKCLLLTIVCLLFCNATCQNDSSTSKIARVAFGSSGGIAALQKRYELSSSGELVLLEGILMSKKEIKTVKKLSKSEMSEVSKRINALELENLKLNNPGNMSYFLEVLNSDSTKTEIIWGGGEPVPTKVKECYEFLLSKVR
jgi:hypothetical protein